jgi:hypothetical protein
MVGWFKKRTHVRGVTYAEATTNSTRARPRTNGSGPPLTGWLEPSVEVTKSLPANRHRLQRNSAPLRVAERDDTGHAATTDRLDIPECDQPGLMRTERTTSRLSSSLESAKWSLIFGIIRRALTTQFG